MDWLARQEFIRRVSGGLDSQLANDWRGVDHFWSTLDESRLAVWITNMQERWSDERELKKQLGVPEGNVRKPMSVEFYNNMPEENQAVWNQFHSNRYAWEKDMFGFWHERRTAESNAPPVDSPPVPDSISNPALEAPPGSVP
jgi:hypothetical protein